jgi:peptidyl-prolyl cis-trans isomerase D
MFSMKGKSLEGGVPPEKLGKNFWTYAVLLSALGAMTFFGVCDPSGRKYGGRGGGISGQAATVGNEVISRQEFQRAYQNAYQQYQRMYQDAFDPSQMRLAHNVMRQLVDDRAMYAKAVELGLRASDDEILQLLTKQEGFKGEDGKFSEEIFNRFLEGNGFTEASFMEEVRRSLTLQKLREFVTETTYVSSKAAELDYRASETKLDVEYLKFDPQSMTVTVPPADVDKLLADDKGKARVKEYFETNTKEFNRPEEVHARHILVSFKGARNATAEGAKRDKAAAKKLADEILAKAKAPGADFAAIAKASTDETAGKATGGDLGFFTRETMDKAFSDAAFALAPGAISGVVESPFGFHIIKVEEKRAPVTTKLEDAQRKIAEQILMKERRPQVAKTEADKVLAALKAKQPDAPLLAEYKMSWQATGEFSAETRFIPGVGASKEVSDALSTLTAPGQLSPGVVDVRGSLFVLRLKSRKEPDMTKLDQDKKRELATTEAYTEGNSMFTAYEKQVRDDIEKKNKIWMNPEYLALDEPKAKDAGT